jgi:hypothetical protein
MKKISTVAAKQSRNISQPKLTATVATRREKKPRLTKKQKNLLDSDRPSHGRRFHSLRIGQP